eukprot:7378208-Prymnesium_polylepis.2
MCGHACWTFGLLMLWGAGLDGRCARAVRARAWAVGAAGGPPLEQLSTGSSGRGGASTPW